MSFVIWMTHPSGSRIGMPMMGDSYMHMVEVGQKLAPTLGLFYSWVEQVS